MLAAITLASSLLFAGIGFGPCLRIRTFLLLVLGRSRSIGLLLLLVVAHLAQLLLEIELRLPPAVLGLQELIELLLAFGFVAAQLGTQHRQLTVRARHRAHA